MNRDYWDTLDKYFCKTSSKQDILSTFTCYCTLLLSYQSNNHVWSRQSSLLALLLFHCEVRCRPSKHKQYRSHMRNGYNRFSAWSKYFIYWSKYFRLLLVITRWWVTSSRQWLLVSGLVRNIRKMKSAGAQPKLSFILSPLRNFERW